MSNDLQQRIRALRTIERRITPDEAWVRATRETLLMQVKNTLPTERVSVVRQTREAIRHFVGSKIGSIVRKPIMAIMSIVVVMTGGSIMSVSAAERSLPGDFFYGLKLATEQARLALVSVKEDKLKLKTEFTQRRVQELKDVVSSDKDTAKVKQVTEILKSDLNTIKEQLNDVKQGSSSETAVAAAKLVDQKTNEVISDLQSTKSQLPPDSKESVTDVQSVAADTGVKAIEVLVDKSQGPDSIVPVADVTEAIQNHANAIANVTEAPLELSGNATSSVTSTVASLMQAIATSTDAMTSSTVELPQLVNQVKDMTAQVFAIQKAKDRLEASSASSSSELPSTSSTTPIDGQIQPDAPTTTSSIQSTTTTKPAG